MTGFQVPVVAVVFNRPDCTRRLMDALRQVRPARLFVISDGPRTERERETVRHCRELMQPDWACTCETLFAEENMGCRSRISSGLDAVFAQVESAIILEDDCLPSASFFPYCQVQLDAFRSDPRVMSVCGYRTFPRRVTSGMAACSHYPNSWGWATWARAWQHYGTDLEALLGDKPHVRLREALGSRRAGWYWAWIFRRIQAGKHDSWAYYWMLAHWLQRGLAIYPQKNLISNTGGDERATHTRGLPFYLRRPAESIDTFDPPADVAADPRVNRWIEDIMYSKSIPGRLIWMADMLVRRLPPRNAG